MPVIEEDIFDNSYTYRQHELGLTHGRLCFDPHISHYRESGTVTFDLLIGFRNSDWVFTNKIIFNCDRKNFTLKNFIKLSNSRTVLTGGDIMEVYLEIIGNDVDLVENILSAKKVRVRFDGQKSHLDRTLSKQDIQNLKKCYECYKKLVAVEEKWER